MADFVDDILGNNSPEPDKAERDDISDRKYKAFLTNSRAVECELRTVNPAWHGLPYAHMYNVIAFSQDFSFLWVVTSYFLVKVKGRRLRPIVIALRGRRAGYLQEFDERRHDIPDDDTAPVITQMDVIIQPASASYKEAAESYGPQVASP